MTQGVTGLKFHTWWLGLGPDMPDFQKFVCEGPWRALTDTLECFQRWQCIYISFYNPQKILYDSRGHRTEVPHMVAWLGAGHARFPEVCVRRFLEGINRHVRVLSRVSMHLYNLFGSTKFCSWLKGSQDWRFTHGGSASGGTCKIPKKSCAKVLEGH